MAWWILGGGRVLGAVLLVHQVLVRRRLHSRINELQNSEEHYRSILENATMGVFRTERTGGIITANPEVARILGYESPDQLIREVTDLASQVYLNPDDRENVLSLVQEHGYASMNLQLRRRDGSPILTRINMWMVKDEAGELRYVEGILEDITERTQAEERVKLYHRIFMGSSDGISIS